MQECCKPLRRGSPRLWQDSHNTDTRSCAVRSHVPCPYCRSTTASDLLARDDSKRVPGGSPGVFEVADVGAEAQPHAGPDRGDDDRTALQERQADAADQIGRAIDAAEALMDLLGVAQVVDEDHHLGAFGACIPADRRPLPVDAVGAGVLGVEGALAVAQPGHERAAGILAQNVAVRAALLLEGVLNHAGEPLADRAEEAVAGLQDFARGVAAIARVVVVARARRRPIAAVGGRRPVAAIGWRVVVGLAGGRTVGLAIRLARRRRVGLAVGLPGWWRRRIGLAVGLPGWRRG